MCFDLFCVVQAPKFHTEAIAYGQYQVANAGSDFIRSSLWRAVSGDFVFGEQFSACASVYLHSLLTRRLFYIDMTGRYGRVWTYYWHSSYVNWQWASKFRSHYGDMHEIQLNDCDKSAGCQIESVEAQIGSKDTVFMGNFDWLPHLVSNPKWTAQLQTLGLSKQQLSESFESDEQYLWRLKGILLLSLLQPRANLESLVKKALPLPAPKPGKFEPSLLCIEAIVTGKTPLPEVRSLKRGVHFAPTGCLDCFWCMDAYVCTRSSCLRT